MEAFRFQQLQRLLRLAEGVPGCLGLARAVVDSAESRLEPLRRRFALLVLALRELEALPGGRELLVPGRLWQFACPLVEGPGRGQFADGVLLGGVHFHCLYLCARSGAWGTVAGLWGAAASPGGLLGVRLPGLPVLGAVPPTFEASRATGEVVNAISAVGAVPVQAHLGAPVLCLALATPSEPVIAELAVEVLKKALDILQLSLGSHSPSGTKSCVPG